jgi:signal transduction histidine kinase
VNRRLERVNVASLRVALISTGVVGLVYTIVAMVVVIVVTNNLTAQVDSRLQTQLQRVDSLCRGRFACQIPRASVDDPGQGDFGAPLLVWAIDTTGETPPQMNSEPAVYLPDSDVDVTSPETISLAGVDVRITGTAVGPFHLIVGYNVDSVSQARSSLIVTETVAGVVLLLLVFGGSLIAGRRVGAPIELARQRQLEFTADASHELRTPLAVIEAQTSLALSQDRDPGWYQNAFRRIGSESGRIRRLVDDLLWLARVDTPQGRPAPEPVEVGVIVSEAVAESRGVTLQMSIGMGPLVVLGSSEWLDRLLGVLLDNACKYAPQGGVVGVSVAVEGNRVRLVVDDSGPGIPEDERSKIFNRFHRAMDQGYGSGLGLAIADAVVRHTHGRWEVTTSPLGGARMVVSWPRALAGSRDQSDEDPAVSWSRPAAVPPPLTD